MKKLIRLTWKYFWQQKWKELKDFFIRVKEFFQEERIFFIIPMLLIGLCFQAFWAINIKTGLPTCKAIAIIGLCMIGFWVMIGLIALTKCICKWLKNNWVKAKARAKRELRN